MKKILKSVVSLFMAAALFITGAPLDGFNVNAAAETTIKADVTYSADGTAVLEIESNDWMNIVRYTTDGSAPTKTSQMYIRPIKVEEKTTFRIAEFNSNDKKVAGIKKVVTPKLPEVEIDVEQADGIATVRMFCANPNAEIRYTLDGSVPDENSDLYIDPIQTNTDTRFRAKPFLKGFKSSLTVTENVKIEEEPEPVVTEEDEDEAAEEKDGKAEKETVVSNEKIRYKTIYADEEGKTYVTLLKSASSNTFRYTTDGSTPSKSSKKYNNKRITFTEPVTLRVREYNRKGEIVGSLKLNVKLKCAPVEFYASDVAVGTSTIVMESKTKDVTIYYTLDGSAPDPEYANIYTGPVVAGSSAVIMAIAYKNNYQKSDVTTDTAGAVSIRLKDFDFSNPIYRDTAALINDRRRYAGFAPLTLDEDLTRAANARAIELYVLCDNTRPNGRNYSSIFSEYGVKAKFSAEYVFTYYSTPEEVVEQIFGNQANKNIILSKGYDYTKIGIGYCEKGRSRYWSVIIVQE